VAPASRARVDTAYQPRMTQVLPQACAQGIREVQKAALGTRRTFVAGKLAELGGSEVDLEYAVSRFDWGFWQYYGAEYCSYVPTTASTNDAFWEFFAAFAGFSAPAPMNLEYSNGALYYEWLTEHGFAHQINDAVMSLLAPGARSSMEDDFRAMFPSVTLPAYDGSVTRDVREWVRDEAENLLLVYGDFDPWSGGAMDAPTRSSSGRFFVPSATHGAQIGMMNAADRKAALALAADMFGREPNANPNKRSFAVDRALADRLNRRDFAVGRSMLRR
jgi:hypothetical protein